MAFFGMDGMEHQLKQLKAQVASKEGEIASMRNEVRKKDEELLEMKRSREIAEYKAQEEGERAHKAETALKQRTTELTNLRLQHDNLQSSLRSANDKLKAGEKENRGLQYDNESLGFSNAEAKKITEERDALTSKVKDLESRLSNSEETIKSLRASTSAPSGMKRSATGFFASSFSPVPAKRTQGGNRRRSTSLSTDNRVNELEAELERLRPEVAELDRVKTQLSGAKKELDKVTNAKLMVERAGKREVEELKSQLDDLNYELGEWRRNDGSGGQAEIDKVKKALAGEIEGFKNRISDLERAVEEKTRQVERLETQLERLESLETELAEEKTKVQTLQSMSSSPAATDDLEAKIASLETALAKARSAAASTSHVAAASTDLTTRQLQRELKSLRAQVERQEEELASQDEEITRLTKQSASRIPLPSSPVLSASHSSDDMARIIELEEEVEIAKKEVETLRSDLKKAEHAAQADRAAAERSAEAQKKLESQLEDARDKLAESEGRVNDLETKVAELQRGADANQHDITQAHETVKAAETERDDLRQRCQDLEAQHKEATNTIATQTATQISLEEMKQSLVIREESIAAMERTIGETRAQVTALEQSINELTGERDDARATASTRQDEISNLMDRLVDAEDRLRTTIMEKKASVKNVKEKHKETLAELDVLKIQVADAQEAVVEAEARLQEMQERYEEASKARFDVENALNDLREEAASRSTESEARQRDEALFDQKEAVEKLQAIIDAQREEHAQEMEAATFILTRDLEEARSRTVALEKELQASAKAKKHLTLAEDKIQRLRVERDDLRLSLHFVNHEHRFASQAADVHRQALDEARLQLDTKHASLERLQGEHADATAQFGQVSSQLEGELKQVTEERAALVTKVEEMEEKLKASLADHQIQAEQSGSLVSDLALARSKASRAEAELFSLRFANKQLEIRHDKAQAILEAKREAEARMEAEGLGESTMTSSSVLEERPSHRRRRSGMFTSSSDLLEGLKVERADLLGRISRRDARIKGLEHEMKQVKINMQLAEESAMESLSDREVIDRQMSELQTAFEAKNAELSSLEECLSQEQISLESSRSALTAVEAKVVSLEGDLESAQSAARVYERSLQEVIVALAAEHHAARLNKLHYGNSITLLRAADASIGRIQASASAALSTAKEQVIDLSTQLDAAHNDLAGKEEQLTAALQIEEDLKHQIASQATIISETTTRLAEVERGAVQLAQTVARVPILEKEISEAKEQLTLRQTDIEELLSKLATAEKNRGAGEHDAQLLAETKQALEETTAQRDALVQSLSELEKEFDISQAAHEDAMAGERASRDVEHERLSQQVAEIQKEVEEKVSLLNEATAKVEQLEQLSEEKQGELEHAIGESESQRAIIEELERKIADGDILQSQVEKLSAQLQDEQATMEDLRTTIASLESSRDTITTQRDELVARTATLESDLSKAQREITRQGQLSVSADTDKALINDLNSQIDILNATTQAVKSERDALSSQIEQIAQELSSTKTELEAAASRGAMQNETMERLKLDIETAKSALAQAEEKVTVAQDTAAGLQRELASTMAEKRGIETQLADMAYAVEKVSEQAVEIENLQKEVSTLESQLASGVTGAADNAEVNDLKDRISELEATLTLKVQEVDEADDKVKEVFKEKVKLEKKIAKLQRQLASASTGTNAETAANTAANKFIPPPVAATKDMAPPPAPRFASAGISSTPKSQNMIPASPRQPLRPVNVFADKVLSPGLKRAREEKIDSKPLSAEMILLPPPQLEQEKTTPKNAFKPMRRVFGENGTIARERVNVFAEQ